MFSYRLPGGLNTCSFFTSDGQIKFDPPIYEVRYTTAVRIIDDERWSEHFKSVADFGCAEMRLLPLLRRVPNIEHILEVDINESLLKQAKHKAEPLIADHLQKRENPLMIDIYKGSVTDSVEVLKNIDVIVALELIEHLYEDDLKKLPQNIFGFIQPKLAIFSTPNIEFNILFTQLLPSGFRHTDHKFEWSRKEFKKWGLDICKQYPNYNVAFIGVGKAPPDHRNIGPVTQIAIFVRKDILNETLLSPIKVLAADENPNVQYQLIHHVDFPYYKDERSKETKILDEAKYHIDRCVHIPRFYNREREIYQIPISIIMEYITPLGATEADLRKVLYEDNIEVENDFILKSEECNYKYLVNTDAGYFHFDNDVDYDNDDSELEMGSQAVDDDLIEECWD